MLHKHISSLCVYIYRQEHVSIQLPYCSTFPNTVRSVSSRSISQKLSYPAVPLFECCIFTVGTKYATSFGISESKWRSPVSEQIFSCIPARFVPLPPHFLLYFIYFISCMVLFSHSRSDSALPQTLEILYFKWEQVCVVLQANPFPLSFFLRVARLTLRLTLNTNQSHTREHSPKPPNL